MEPIKILFTGDFCPHNRIEALSASKDYASIFNNYIDVFQGNDLNVTDIECPLTTSKKRIPKTGPYQFAAPHNIGILQFANIRLASMANNHIMDCDAEGAFDSILHCTNAGIKTVGIGKTVAERRQPFSTEIKGKKIAIISFAENEFIAAPGGEIAVNPLDPVNNYYDIIKAKKEHDFVMLFIHGGNEFYQLPSPRMKQTYRYFIDIGADAIISNHTHCYSGYEVYHGKPIFYSLGNFIYDWPGRVNTDWNHGFTVKLLITDTIDFEIIPLKQNNEVPGVFHLTTEEKKNFDTTLHERSLIIADDKQLSAAFENYCNSVKRMYEAFIEPSFGPTIASLRARGFFPKLMSKQKRLLLLNLTRCESHRDVLLKVLPQ